jgi:hypothetical protein
MSSRIIMAAHNINKGIMPDLRRPQSDSDFYFVAAAEPEKAVSTIVNGALTRPPLPAPPLGSILRTGLNALLCVAFGIDMRQDNELVEVRLPLSTDFGGAKPSTRNVLDNFLESDPSKGPHET